MYKLLLISVFGKVEADNNDRVNSLHDYLKFYVKIVTTDFLHRDKKYRALSKRNVEYLHVLPYKSDISVKRIISHWFFAIKLFFYLVKNGKHYDIIYCISPTPSSIFSCAAYKLFYKHKCFVVDVLDIWPEGLIGLNQNYKFIYPLLLPWKWLSIFAYKNANAIIAATNSFQKIASKHNKSAYTNFYPLGIDHERIIQIKAESKLEITKSTQEIWIAYAGNLGASYDFDSMIDAINFVNTNLSDWRIRFIIIGDGDRKLEIQSKLQDYAISYIVTGYLTYSDYLYYLSICDIGLNIFPENSEVAQSYKFNDYIASNLYVLNNLRGETAELIEKYSVGLNVIGQNSQLGLNLLAIIKGWNLIKKGQDVRCNELITKELAKKTIYSRLGDDLMQLLSRPKKI